MKHFLIITAAFLLLFLNIKAEDTIRVGISDTPPFIIKTNTGYKGACIDMWQSIADSLNVAFLYYEYPLSSITNALDSNDIDIAISPLTITSNRIKKYYFSQPYYITSLAYAIRKDSGDFWGSFLSDFFSWNFFKALFSLFSIIFIFGIITWLMERKKNHSQFRKDHKGLGDGIWWSAVTMSTVGYGDKSPRTAAGRILAIIWMFTAVIVISSFTASISSSLTVHRLKSRINNIDDLRKVNVGTIKKTGSSEFLNQYKIYYKNFQTVNEGIDALNSCYIDAFVFDDAVLSYFVERSYHKDNVQVIPSAYFKEYFSIASKDQELINQINYYLISYVDSPVWINELDKYHIKYRD